VVKDLNIEKARLVISTIENFEESRLILDTYKKINKKVSIILVAADDDEAAELYKYGGDLIIVPTTISSDFISYTLEKIMIKGVKIEELKQKSIRAIEKHKVLGVERKFVKSISN
jgi:voltage-gated potassium channel Kch